MEMDTNKAEQLSLDGVATDAPHAGEPLHMIARFNAMAVKIVAPFVAHDDVRFYLNGINVRPLDDGSVMIVATDGHRYVVVHDPAGYAERELIVATRKDGLKAAGPKSTFDVMSNGAAFINDEHGAPQFVQPGNSLIEGEFPRIESVASTLGYKEGISGAVNPSFLVDALAIAKHFGSIRFFTRDQDSALLFVVGGLGASELEVFGGIMKIRDSFEQLPAWFPKPTPFNLAPSPSKPLRNTADSAPAAGERDPLFDEALEIVRETGKASISAIQRRLRIGYNRAAKIIEQLEDAGPSTPSDDGGPNG
ncbi:DNA translocase FtsK [Paraburkholderia sp. J10-1]|uniref:DNA translocase FtsK n=1 Tax=Paraburkholderia sp. J10-1 TaxID=2805430 RepID=UPI002AB6ECA0|nr:DNA translocase FtsK [Paraburkholderia sp. J10-1]